MTSSVVVCVPAEIVTDVVDVTAVVVTVNVALVAPAFTVTPEGGLATGGLLLERLMNVPPFGAGPLSVTVPVDGVPPETIVGFKPTDVTESGLSVNVADCVPLYVAEMEIVVWLLTDVVVIVKAPVVAPAKIETFAGTAARLGLLLDSVTSAPPLGATPPRVTVPVEDAPPVVVAGFSDTDARVSGLTDKVADCVPLYVPCIETGVTALTALVLTVNEAVVDPAGTVTVGGTVAAEVLLLLRVTTAPPGGAIADKVMVPVDEFPPLTLVGFSTRLEMLAGATDPNTAISASPMFKPVALFTVNCIQLTIF